MTALKLLIANKSYSSWSMRPWLLLEQFGIPFEEIVVPLDEPDSKARMRAINPAGKAPALVDGDLTVWDSLAICEYVAEQFPQHAIWPRAKEARAMARSIAAEMHSSFQSLRQQCPMVVHRQRAAIDFSAETLADIARIEAIWRDAREKFGQGGPFLFGAFSAADAMYAPIVVRFATFDAPVADASRAYMAAIEGTPGWAKWMKGAAAERWRIPRLDSK